MSTRTRKNLFLSVFAVALLAGTIGVVQNFVNGEAGAQEAGAEMPAMPVPIVTTSQKPLQIWKEFSARLAAVDYVEIRPQVSGLIQKVHFTDGQVVEAGDLLYTIDTRPYEAAANEARAALSAANDQNTYAQQELKRAEELKKTGALSKQVYDQRVSEARVARSNITGANARLKSAQVDLDRASIEAPITGRISRTEITEGNLVSSATAPLLTSIVSDKDIYADFDVDEQTYLKYIRQSDVSVQSERAIPVKMKLSSDAKWYDGMIKSFDNKIDPSSGTIRARAVFSNDDGALLPGMFAQVQIGSASEEERISIPEKAVGTDQNRKYVYIIENGVATYREVKLGDRIGADRVVLSGLKVGEQVIVDGLMKLRPGAKVQGMTPEQMEQMKSGAAAGAAPAAAPEAATETPAPETAPAETALEEAPAKTDAQEQPVVDLTIQPVQPQAQE